MHKQRSAMSLQCAHYVSTSTQHTYVVLHTVGVVHEGLLVPLDHLLLHSQTSTQAAAATRFRERQVRISTLQRPYKASATSELHPADLANLQCRAVLCGASTGPAPPELSMAV
jgi:hypothetical protein